MWQGAYTTPITTGIPAVLTGSLPSGIVGTPYSAQLTAQNTNGPFVWSIASGALPAGLTLNKLTGLVSGTPTTAQTATAVFQVLDSLSQICQASLSLTIAPGTGTGLPVQAMFDGAIDTTSITFEWFPPTSQTAWVNGLNYTAWTPGPTSVGATGLTLQNPWAGASGVHTLYFQEASAEVRAATFTAGSTAVTWTGGLNGNIPVSNLVTNTPQVYATGINGTPDYYKVLKDGVAISMTAPPLVNPGVTANPTLFLGNAGILRPQGWLTDTFAPSSAPAAHTYTVIPVTNGQDGPAGPPLTLTALPSPSASALPALAADPSTWIQDGTGALNQGSFVLPTGVTPTILTQSSQANYNAVGGLGWALSAANPNFKIDGPNVIVVPLSLGTITVPGAGGVTLGGAVIPAFTGSAGWTYIISDQEPIYNASGTLIPYAPSTAAATLLPILCNGGTAIAAGATSATIPAWTLKTGWYYAYFTEGTAPNRVIEERLALFTNGSTTVDWSKLNPLYAVNTIGSLGAITGGSGYTNGTHNDVLLTGGTGAAAAATIVVAGGVVTSITNLSGGNNFTVGDVLSSSGIGPGTGFSVPVATVLPGGPGLSAAANATIQVKYCAGVTPFDAASMPQLAFGTSNNQTCLQFTAGATKVRFVGLNFKLLPNLPRSAQVYFSFSNVSFSANPAPCEHIYFDRCLVGFDTNDPQWSMCQHGFSAANVNHLLVHQCYFHGIAEDFNFSTGDTNNNLLDGGFHSWESTYVQAGSEDILYGGSFVAAPPNMPHDIVIRNCVFHWPASWLVGYPNRTSVATPWRTFGAQVKDHVEFKCGVKLHLYGNLCMNAWMGVIQSYHCTWLGISCRDQTGGGTTPNAGCPWNRVTDVSAHDNLLYQIGTPFYCFTGDFESPTAYSARIHFYNNQCWLSPLMPGTRYAERVQGIHIQGPVVDIIVEKNTMIVNTSASTAGVGPQNGASWVFGGTGAGSFFNTPPYGPGSWNAFQDRMTWRNNIQDSGVGANRAWNFLVIPSVTGFSNYPNLTMAANVVINDNAPYGTTTPGVNWVPGVLGPTPYTSIGFANWQGNDVMPSSPSDWDVVSGPLATAATDGGPVGYQAPQLAGLFLGNSFQGISTTITSSDSQDTFFQFTGTDAKYGNVLPRAAASAFLFGGTGGNDKVQQTCTSKLASGYSADIVESIATDNTVPSGVSSTVRVSTLVNPYDQTVHTQNSYLINPGSGTPTMVYVSHWIWLQADMPTRTGGFNPFGEFVEFKTPGATTERFQVGYQMCGNPNNNWTHFGTTPVFIMLHDLSSASSDTVYFQDVISPSTTQSTWGQFQTHVAPIPLGRWFKLEWAFNRSDSAGQGWMWAALTDPGSSDPQLQAGVQFWAARGAFNYQSQTIGMNQSLSSAIDRIFIDNTNYTNMVRSSSSTYVVKTTDYQVYTSWPSTATAHPANYT